MPSLPRPPLIGLSLVLGLALLLGGCSPIPDLPGPIGIPGI